MTPPGTPGLGLSAGSGRSVSAGRFAASSSCVPRTVVMWRLRRLKEIRGEQPGATVTSPGR